MSELTIGIDMGTYTPADNGYTITLNELDFTLNFEQIVHIENMTQGKLYYKIADRLYSNAKNISLSNNVITIHSQDNKPIQKDDEIKIKVDGISNTQYPVSINGDSLYASDIDIVNSDNGNFSGTVLDYFTSLKSVNTDSTSNNPKTIKIWLNRTIQTHAIGFGCDDLSKSFSNIVIKALGSGEAVRYTDDRYQNDSTKRNSFLLELPPLALNGILIEFHTTDEVCLSNLIVFKANDINSRIKAVSSLTGNVETVTSYRKALDVNPAYVHRKIVNETFHQNTGISSNLSSPASVGDTSVVVVSSVGFTIGSEIVICEGETREIGLLTITGIVSNTLILDRPLANDYTVGLNVCEVISNMAVLGTLASPSVFEIKPPLNTVWQITRYLPNIVDNLAADDSKFGGTAALTNGVVLKATTEAGRSVVFSNWKTNGDLKLDMYNVDYTDKAGGGNYGVNGRWTFTSSEVVAEIDGSDPLQKLEILIQDNLTALVDFRIKAQGRVFSP